MERTCFELRPGGVAAERGEVQRALAAVVDGVEVGLLLEEVPEDLGSEHVPGHNPETPDFLHEIFRLRIGCS